MLDKISWEIFIKTGSINAYLLYNDIKNLNNIQNIDTSLDSEVIFADTNL